LLRQTRDCPSSIIVTVTVSAFYERIRKITDQDQA
jgi:hypothetical protein